MKNKEQLNSIEHRVKQFSDLLDEINGITDKKKELWKQIYENAVMDRDAALAMYMQLVTLVSGKSTEHAVHGQNMNKYLERMSKCNDQLIKLAELVADAEKKSESLNPEDMFNKIST